MNTITDARTWIDNTGIELTDEEAARLARPLWDVCQDWDSSEPTLEDLREAMEAAGGFELADFFGPQMICAEMPRRADIIEERVTEFYDDAEETRLREAHGDFISPGALKFEVDYISEMLGNVPVPKTLIFKCVCEILFDEQTVFVGISKDLHDVAERMQALLGSSYDVRATSDETKLCVRIGYDWAEADRCCNEALESFVSDAYESSCG